MKRSALSKKTLIFDFDGTICDTFTEANLNQFYLKLPKNIKEKFPFKLIQQYRDYPIVELFKMANLNSLEIALLAYKLRNQFAKMLDQFKPIQGIPDVLGKFAASGIRLFILTSNRKSNIEKFLKANSINFFEDVCSEYRFHKKDTKIEKLVKKYSLTKSETFYIGDEVRDIEAAKAAGVGSVAVTWGMNGPELLTNQKPSLLANKPEDLLALLNSKYSGQSS